MKRALGHAVFCLTGFAAMLAVNSLPADIVNGQVDAFTSGTADGWREGAQSPNPPAFDNGNGSDGLAGHLMNISGGGGGAGSRQLMWNDDSRWQGNYFGAGVSSIQVFADNRSGNGNDFNLRLAFDGPGGWFVTDAFALADGSGWTGFTYDIRTGLTHIAAGGGTGVLADTMTAVERFEILSSAGLPSFAGNGDLLRGDSVAGDLRIDNITAIPEPAAGLLLTLVAFYGVSRRRR